MLYKRYMYVLFLYTLLSSTALKAPFKLRNKQQKNCSSHIPTQKKPTIIIDLTNVLFKESSSGFAPKIGYGVLASYAFTHLFSKTPLNAGHRCLDTLAQISKDDAQKPFIHITLKNRTMPQCIVELLEGKKSCSETRDEITQCIEQLNKTDFFSCVKEKNLMITIMNLILDPHVLATVTEPIKQTVILVQKLKNAGHNVYLFANAPQELYSSIQKNYPDIIKLFDNVIISSHIKKVKPDISAFNHLLTTHNLDPKECILIDDLEETASIAKILGMQAIVFDKPSNVTQKLKKMGVIF